MSDKKQSLNKEKPYFQQFVEANMALIDCYERANNKDPKGDSAILATCTQHRERVEDLLRRNVLAMTNLVEQRVQILNELGPKNKPVPVEPKLF